FVERYNVNNHPHQNQVSEPEQYSNFNHVDNRQHHNQINKSRQRRTSSLNYPIEGEKITDEGIKVTTEYGQREGEHSLPTMKTSIHRILN
uniref:hypothetical protein n=1 Tax=Piscirickettsia salmonis TaxID=1238 RepID=UPI00053BE2F5